jgi:hypothetical protein
MASVCSDLSHTYHRNHTCKQLKLKLTCAVNSPLSPSAATNTGYEIRLEYKPRAHPYHYWGSPIMIGRTACECLPLVSKPALLTVMIAFGLLCVGVHPVIVFPAELLALIVC